MSTKNSINLGGCYVNAKSKITLCKTVGGLSGKFKRMIVVYEYFAKDWKHCMDFSDQMKIELYNSESFGTQCSENNGYLLGKKWLNVTISMWKEDINKGLLFKEELYNDPNLPEWFLDSIFKQKENKK